MTSSLRETEGAFEHLTVFLDTEVFDKHSFNFDHPNFKTLLDYVEKGYVTVVLTTVTVGEVEAHIRQEVHDATAHMKKVADKHRIVRSVTDTALHSALTDGMRSEAETALLIRFRNLCKRLLVDVRAVDDVDAEEIFKDYFAAAPPFGEGRKKHEFPDAFAIRTLKAWCDEEERQVYVVSGDADWHRACEGVASLVHVASLGELLELIPGPKVVAAIKKAVASRWSEVVDEVNNQFRDRGFVVTDVEGDVDDVRVTDLRATETYVTEAVGGEARVEITAELEFEADVSYDVPGTGFWDSEDKALYFPDRTNETTTTVMEAILEISIVYDPDDPEQIEIMELELAEPAGDLTVDMSEVLGFHDHH